MTKITKVWFDENLGDVPNIPWDRIWLTREELAARFDINLVNEPCKPEIWYGVDFAQPGSDRTVVWHGSQQTGKSLALADIQRAIDVVKNPLPLQPYCLTADLYDRMQAAGMCLGGVTRLDPPPRYAVRPPAAAKSRAALHPLVGRLIDNLNKEN